MKGYRFITSDDTSEFCHRVTEAIKWMEIIWWAKNDIWSKTRSNAMWSSSNKKLT